MSNFCMYCKELLIEINKNSLQNQVQYINVDRSATNNPVIPPYVTSVPTLIIQGEPKPYVGEMIFNWIESLKKSNESSNGGPNPWHNQEMGGNSFSDCYSFLDGDSTNSSDAIPHQFSYLGETNSINTPQESGGNNNQIEQPQNDISQRMEMLQSQREQEINAPVQRI